MQFGPTSSATAKCTAWHLLHGICCDWGMFVAWHGCQEYFAVSALHVTAHDAIEKALRVSCSPCVLTLTPTLSHYVMLTQLGQTLVNVLLTQLAYVLPMWVDG